MTTYTTHRHEEIALEDLTARDLREEAEGWDGETHAYRVTLYDDAGIQQAPEHAEALVINGRIGIAWGGNAIWSDSSGHIEHDITGWLTDEDWAR